jgi:hypothetical protein
MKYLAYSLLLLALEVPGLIRSLSVPSLRGIEHWLLVLILGAIFLWGPSLFLAGLISLLVTRAFLRKAESAIGRVSAIYEVTPAGASDYLFPSRIVTVRFWTQHEECIAFQSPTFQGNPETVDGSIPVLYDPNRPVEAKIHSLEGLWLTPGLVLLIGAGLSLIFTGLLVSVLR